MCDIVFHRGHRNVAAHHMGDNYGLRPYIQMIAIAAPVITVATIITTSVHFAVDKLGEIDDEVLVVANSKPEVENALEIDRFYEHLHGRAKH